MALPLNSFTIALLIALLVVPWIVVLIVFVGEKWQANKVIGVLADTLQRAQAGVVAAHLPSQAAPPVALPPAVPVALPKAPPVPVAPVSSVPPWFAGAQREIGFHEIGNNGGLDRYIAMAHCGANGEPWCAIFANAMLEQAGVTGTRSASSQSFRTDPNFVPLPGPALGALAVFWRGSRDSGLGHVGFYAGEDATRVWTLGGNENDMVQEEALPKSSDTFGLIGYFWPKGVALPQVGAVTMPAGSPVSVKTPSVGTASTVANGVQTGITATVFGGPQSAYGGAIDDNRPGVALPHRFPSPRPQVRLTNRTTGATCVCDIVDIGPWNIEDPYWQTGARPQAESGFDLGQTTAGRPRKTNRAGIDLTLAAAKAVGVDGKGVVSWEFIQSALPETPKVT